MYYIYDKKEKILMADQDFINLLECKNINEVIKSAVLESIKFEEDDIYITLKDKTIKAKFIETTLYSRDNDEIKFLKISNIIELKNSTSQIQLNYNPIYLDVDEISQEMGLSVEDYKLYLNSFINQSIVDYDKLLSGDDKAIKNLSTLALTLKIPNLNILLLKINRMPKEERPHYVDEYYTKLTLLTIRESDGKKTNLKTKSSKDSVIFEDDILALDNKKIDDEEKLNSKFTELMDNFTLDDDLEPPKESIKPKVEKKKPQPPKPTIKKSDDLVDLSLDDFDDDFNLDLIDDRDLVPPKPTKKEKKGTGGGDSSELNLENAPKLPINYNPKIAADELNLPVVLIEEFVEDFIEQAHHDKDHLLTSYYQKDMDNIHELGHKLKGAASNLRINELADVLEEIQFCTDYSKLKGLFIKYWGLFKSLEEYMKQPNKL